MSASVMVADDNEAILNLVAATLEDDDRYKLILARDGEEALEKAREEKPEMIFLDILMPRLNGFEVCRRLKLNSATAHIKVVMLSALTQQQDILKAQEAGADDYLTKPFSPTTLLDKIEQLLQGQVAMDRESPGVSFKGLSREQMEIYAIELHQHYIEELRLRQELQTRVRELGALNRLLQQHLSECFLNEDAYRQVAQDLQHLGQQMAALAELIASRASENRQGVVEPAADGLRPSLETGPA